MNPATAVDFYKTGHIVQYPENTQSVYSNMTPRSDKHAPILQEYWDKKIVVFGIQAFCIDYLIRDWNLNFFRKNKDIVIKKYKRRMDNALGQDVVTTEHLEALHDLGYLPVRIKAIKEGSRVNIGVPVMTVRETIQEFYWLTNYLETVISCETWKPMTVATVAYEYRKIMERFADLTGAPKEVIDIQCHDFSMRGMSGRHDAMMCGMGHLLSFVGTDTVMAIDGAEEFYFANSDEEMIGCSVPATEHSVMCMGTKEDEIETFRRLITETYPTGIVSIVSDTWDFWKVITDYTVQLKDEIMSRQPNDLGLNKVVFRPDSGCPVKILTGYTVTDVDLDNKGECLAVTTEAVRDRESGKYYILNGRDNGWTTEFDLEELQECEVKGAVECLWEVFGGTLTDKGYKLLDEHVGLIYGDSITLQRAHDILSRLEAKGFASTNVVFGVGSYTYQYLTRDSFGFAVKATHGVVEGENREIFKDPVTDDGTKKSAKGYLRVEKEGNDYVLYDQQTEDQEREGVLETVFENGFLCDIETFDSIRKRLLNGKS